MSNEVKIELTASETRLVQGLRRGETAIKTYGDRALTVFKRVNDSLVNSYNRLGALAPLGIGVGFTALAKNVMEFDSALRKIRMSGGHSKEDIAALRQEIMGLTQTMPVSKDQFAGMAKALSDTGIPLETIKKILPDVARGAKAAGVDTGVYAETVGELLDKYKVAVSDLPELQDQLNAAMKFEDVRKNPEEFLKSLQSLSRTMQMMKSSGIGNVTPLLALMGQLTAVTGSSGAAAGSLDALFNGLLRISKNKDLNSQLKARGIDFFDAKGGVKSINELIPQIRKFGDELKKSGKSAEEGAMSVFGKPEAAKTIITMLDKYAEVAEGQKKLGQSADDMGKDYTDVQESMSSKLQRFQNQIDSFNVTHMSAALEKVKVGLDFLNAHPIIAKGLMYAIMGAGGLVMINKVIEAVNGIKSVFTGGKGGGFGAGIPVYVTNSGGLPGGGPGGAKPSMAWLAGLQNFALPIIGLTGRAWVLENRQKLIEADDRRRAERMGAMPLAIQSRFGQFESLPSFQPGMVGNMPTNKINVNLSVNIDKNGRVTTNSDDTNTSIDMDRGDFGLMD